VSTTLDGTRTTPAGAASALTFLVMRSGRNRLRVQLARLKNVRYVLGMLFLIAYYAFFLRPDRLLGIRRPNTDAMPSAILTDNAVMISALMLTVLVAYWWTFGTKLSAIALSRAESRQLLPAPLSRNELILFKLARSSIATLLSAVILAIISRRGTTVLPFALRVVSYLVMFGTFQLHQLGATLTRSGGKPVGEKLGRRGWIIGGMVVGAIALAIAASLAPAWPAIAGGEDIGASADRLRAALYSMPALLVIAPARAVIAPLGAATIGEWLRVFPVAVAIWLLHVPWIMLNRTPFEEAAVAAGERREALRAAMRAQRASGGRGIGALIAARAALGRKTYVARRTWLPLPPTGPAWMAITWKNFIPTIRQMRWVTLLVAALGIAAIGALIAWISYQKTADLPQSILIARNTLAAIALGLAVVWTIVGPLYTRNDFRSDLPYLRLLRTLPLESGSLVGAQIAASTVLIFAFQLICLVAALLLPGGDRVPGFGQRIVMFLALVLALLTLDVLSVTVRNAIALFFPGWVKLGGESGGFEVIGQNLLGTAGSLLLLLLLLIIPVALAGGVLYTIHTLPTVVTGRVAFALIAFVAAIAAELWFLFHWLGTIYDNIDAGEILEAA
jgi:hypothetical protein